MYASVPSQTEFFIFWNNYLLSEYDFNLHFCLHFQILKRNISIAFVQNLLKKNYLWIIIIFKQSYYTFSINNQIWFILPLSAPQILWLFFTRTDEPCLTRTDKPCLSSTAAVVAQDRGIYTIYVRRKSCIVIVVHHDWINSSNY